MKKYYDHLGLGDFGALDTLLSYTMVGVGTDLALLLLGKPETLLALRKAGFFAYLAEKK